MEINTAVNRGLIFKKGRLSSLEKKLRRDNTLHFMILPSVIIYILVHYMAMYGVMMAFENFDIFKGFFKSPLADYGGFGHFRDFFTDPSFFHVMKNTIGIALLKLVILMPLPVVLAIMLNELNFVPFKRLAQTATYLPHFISWVIIGGLIYTWADPDIGIINEVLVNFHIISEPINFVAENSLFWPLLIFSEGWKETGYGSILYLAAISTIDPNLYEAAEVDGASRLQKIIHITLPFLKGTFVILLILACAGIMSGSGDTFNQCYILGNSMNRDASTILDIYVLRQGIEFGRYSFATAVGLFKSVVSLALLLSANYISKKLTDRTLF